MALDHELPPVIMGWRKQSAEISVSMTGWGLSSAHVISFDNKSAFFTNLTYLFRVTGMSLTYLIEVYRYYLLGSFFAFTL